MNVEPGSREEARQSRLELLGAIAAGLAHEIRNPLSTLSVNLQLLAEDWEGAVTAREKRTYNRVRSLLRETHRLEEILSDFLRFAAGHELNTYKADINHPVRETVDFVAPEAEQGGVLITADYDTEIPPVELDSNLFKQAFYNILLNAIQAMPQGGEVVVRTYQNDGQICVSVEDNGPGIPEEVYEKIFDVYFSTRTGGTGLGLPTTRRIIEEHGGTIDVESKPGCTRFVVCIPLPEGNDD